jgi:hypothetical protein
MSPPTDTLYKFLAISGILVVGFFATTTAIVLGKTEQARIESIEKAEVASILKSWLDASQSMNKSEIDAFSREHELYAEVHSNLLTQAAAGEIKSEKLELLSFIEERRDISREVSIGLIDEQWSRTVEYAKIQAEIASADYQVVAIREGMTALMLFASLGIFFGLLISGTGFWYWYSTWKNSQDE